LRSSGFSWLRVNESAPLGYAPQRQRQLKRPEFGVTRDENLPLGGGFDSRYGISPSAQPQNLQTINQAQWQASARPMPAAFSMPHLMNLPTDIASGRLHSDEIMMGQINACSLKRSPWRAVALEPTGRGDVSRERFWLNLREFAKPGKRHV
jgi:hypothetical protein